MNNEELGSIKSIVENICQKPDKFFDWPPILLGAILAILGGTAVECIKKVIEKRSERKYISILLEDELEEIVTTIDKLEETWNQIGSVQKNYLEDLKSNNIAYEHVKNRLFLFKNRDNKKEISKLYKDIQKSVLKWIDIAGSLSEAEASKREQESIKIEFVTLRARAKALISCFK